MERSPRQYGRFRRSRSSNARPPPMAAFDVRGSSWRTIALIAVTVPSRVALRRHLDAATSVASRRRMPRYRSSARSLRPSGRPLSPLQLCHAVTWTKSIASASRGVHASAVAMAQVRGGTPTIGDHVLLALISVSGSRATRSSDRSRLPVRRSRSPGGRPGSASAERSPWWMSVSIAKKVWSRPG
jgi:hypothetical protein